MWGVHIYGSVVDVGAGAVVTLLGATSVMLLHAADRTRRQRAEGRTDIPNEAVALAAMTDARIIRRDWGQRLVLRSGR